jgi:hypothetical protein
MSQESSSGKELLMRSCGIFIIAIIIGSTSTYNYAQQKQYQSSHKPTACFIKDYSLVQSNCLKKECKLCRKISYICYLRKYFIVYNVSNGRQIQSTTTPERQVEWKSVRI